MVEALHLVFHEGCELDQDELEGAEFSMMGEGRFGGDDYTRVNLSVRQRQSNHLPIDMRFSD